MDGCWNNRSITRFPTLYALLSLSIAVIAVGCGGAQVESPQEGKRASLASGKQDPASPTNPRDCRRALSELVSEVRQAQGLPAGSVAVSLVTGNGATVSGGRLADPFARSTIKVLILAKLLGERGGPDGLTPGEDDAARRMIVDSDNGAASELYAQLVSSSGGPEGAAAGMTGLLKMGGDRNTKVPAYTPPGLPSSFVSNYGATYWRPEDQARFMHSLLLGELIDSRSLAYLLRLMGKITELGGGSWGMGALPDRYRPRFKPGWGDTPDGLFLARQVGTVGPVDRIPRTTLSLAAIAPDQNRAYSAVSSVSQRAIDALEGPCGRQG